MIGAGGVGSWLAPSLIKLTDASEVTIIDGDTLEAKNLDRQLYREDQIGENKAEALAKTYGCGFNSHYYYQGLFRVEREDILIGCADNHAARKSVLDSCDYYKCRAIIACNETHSAEAFYYQPSFKDGSQDPRTYYPEINTDTRNDPRRRAMGCTGEAQRNNRQLVSANFMAAALAQHLFVLWVMEARKMKKSTLPHLPVHLSATLTGLTATKKERTQNE